MPVPNLPTLVMEKVEKMPSPSRYADQADLVRAQLILTMAPMLVARHSNRNALDSLAYHLRKFGDVNASVTIETRDKDGKPNGFVLHAEYNPAAPKEE